MVETRATRLLARSSSPDNAAMFAPPTIAFPQSSQSYHGQPKVELPTFNGVDDVHTWIMQAEQAFSLMPVERAHMVAYATLRFQGSAATWWTHYVQQNGHPSDWET